MRRVLQRLRAGLRRRERVVPVVPRAVRRRWERAAADNWAATLHLLYLRHRDEFLPAYFAKFHAYPTPRKRLTRAWRWYVSDVLIQSARVLRDNGRTVRQVAGVPLRRQLRDVLSLSVSLPSMPENYYKYELYRPANRSRAEQYLHRHETKGALYEMLGTLGEVPDLHQAAPLNDKVAFAAHAEAAGLAVVSTLAVLHAGAVVPEQAQLPAADLFVKPMAGKGGRGAQRWEYVAETGSFRRVGPAAVEVPRDRLLRWLAAQPDGDRLLVQQCLANHAELADLALDAVPTCRLITMLNEAGEPEPVISIFRMPAVRGTIVDNMHRGGLAAPVEITTGVLGAASGYVAAGPASRHTHHPVSGGIIEGRKLPLWDEVLDLARCAHRSFRPRLLVGWDISFGPAGPVLVEGNEQPGVDGLQRLHDLPLGSHRFGGLLVHHLTSRFQLT